MLPSRFAAVAGRPHLRALLGEQIDMQCQDLRALLRLPLSSKGLDGGQNLTATTLLCNIIAGASVLFFESSDEFLHRENAQQSGARFKALLREYYPWESEELGPSDGVRILYGYTRNPLAHSLGVGKNRIGFPGFPGNGPSVEIAKRPLTDDEILDLLSAHDRPVDLPRTIEAHGQTRVVNVHALSWGVFRLLHRLLGDLWQAGLAEQTAHALRTGVPEHRPELPEATASLNLGWWRIHDSVEWERAAKHEGLIGHEPAGRRPPLVHRRTCRALTDKVLLHLADGQGGRYYWLADLPTARAVFAARRCFACEPARADEGTG